MQRSTWVLGATFATLVLGSACSSDDTSQTTVAPTTAPESADGAPTALEIRVMAQEQLGRAINGVDYECEMPTSTEPGTEFACAGELNQQELHVIATINPDGTVTLTMLD